ncbi:neuropeptide FF receptor 1-like isoform X2 [Montipora capricornis]|uniref:neuropeptide FF receptor 1-like isoform X2 n=1 Tax=Montipora capricornis TaxID=246305 RepID=UPI0035F17713
MNNSLENLSEETPTSQMDNFSEPLGLRIFRLTLYVVIFLLATVGNALVIFVVYKSRELHTVTGFLIANLAVADLGVGLLCIPFTVVYFELNFYWPFGPVMCKLLPALMPCFVMGSVGTMLAISIGLKLRQATKEGGDRPGFTQAQATKRIIKMLSAVVICYALCFLPFHTFYFMFDSGELQSRQVRITSSHHVYVLECFTFPQKNPLPPKTAKVPDGRHVGFAIIMQISYTLLRGQTTEF